MPTCLNSALRHNPLAHCKLHLNHSTSITPVKIPNRYLMITWNRNTTCKKSKAFDNYRQFTYGIQKPCIPNGCAVKTFFPIKSKPPSENIIAKFPTSNNFFFSLELCVFHQIPYVMADHQLKESSKLSTINTSSKAARNLFFLSESKMRKNKLRPEFQ